jgi:hypothetical protein
MKLGSDKICFRLNKLLREILMKLGSDKLY